MNCCYCNNKYLQNVEFCEEKDHKFIKHNNNSILFIYYNYYFVENNNSSYIIICDEIKFKIEYLNYLKSIDGFYSLTEFNNLKKEEFYEKYNKKKNTYQDFLKLKKLNFIEEKEFFEYEIVNFIMDSFGKTTTNHYYLKNHFFNFSFKINDFVTELKNNNLNKILMLA